MQIHIDELEQRWITIATAVLGVFFASLIAGAVVFGVRPAQPGGVINPLLIDQSEFASPGVRHMGGNRYEATVLAFKWAFSPSQITLPEGAEVTFRVTSRDIQHGLMIEHHNINLQLLPGHIAEARLTFDEAGEFRILCHEYCGNGHHLMHAGITIVPEEEFVAMNQE